MRTVIIFVSIFGYWNIAFGQKNAEVPCAELTTITNFLAQWKSSDSAISHPLLSKRNRPIIGHPFMLGKSRYYSSSISFPGQNKSEFGMDDENKKCFYAVHFGPYPMDKIDEEGKKLALQVQSCLNGPDWQVSEIDNTYLYISYRRVDIPVQIMKYKIPGSDNYWLSIYMFRYTPK